MKSDKELQNEILGDLIKSHTELTFNTSSPVHQGNIADRIAYASVGIEFAIKWLKDEEALKDGLSLPEKLIFELKDGEYVHIKEEKK